MSLFLTHARPGAAALVAVAVLVAAAPPVDPAAASSPATREVDELRGLQWALDRIRAVEAWDHATGAGVVIAVVSTGVDLRHPELRDGLVVLEGADLVDPSAQDGPDDTDGRGTHAAGIAAGATGNGAGIAGVAPEARIMPVRAFDGTPPRPSGAASRIAWLAAGIRFATDHGAQVILVPHGLGAEALLADRVALDAVVEDAWAAGAVLVAAAGDDARPVCYEPAASARVLCVGATDRRDLQAMSSNFDALAGDIVFAPGGGPHQRDAPSGACALQGDGVLSTDLRLKSSGTCTPQDGFVYRKGTGPAAAHVAGVAALLVAMGLDNQAVADRIVATAHDLGTPGRDPVYGHGRVDALAAVTGARARS